jgi:hypothetical protein
MPGMRIHSVSLEAFPVKSEGTGSPPIADRTLNRTRPHSKPTVGYVVASLWAGSDGVAHFANLWMPAGLARAEPTL